MTTLAQLKPDTRFRLADPLLPLTGTLEMVNECRARVRLDRATVDVEFTGSDGETRAFKASRGHVTSWAPCVEVVPLDADGNAPPPDRSRIWGHPVAAVLRWCGVQGWSAMEAKAACLDLGADLRGVDIAAEVLAGARGAPCARLTARQATEMEAML